jgi:hypothetical protein
MAEPVPVDYNPFGSEQAQAAPQESAPAGPVPVDYDPFNNEPDYKNMPVSTMLGNAASAAIPGALTTLGNIGHAVAPWNWKETGQGLYKMGSGIASGAAGALGYDHFDPEGEKVAYKMIEPLTSYENFAKAMTENPFDALAIPSIVATGGAGALARGASFLGEASAAGRAASLASKASKAASYAMDPVKLTMGAAEGAGNIAKGALKKTVEVGTNVPASAYDLASRAGASANPAVKEAFNSFAKGEGDVNEYSKILNSSFNNIKDKGVKGWAAEKQANFNALQQDASMQPILDAINAERQKLTTRGLNRISDEAHEALDSYEKQIANRQNLPAGDVDRKIESLDKLKQDIGVEAQSTGNPRAQNALWGVYQGTKKAISDVSPEYSDMMENYQSLQNHLKNLSTGSGINKGGNAAIMKGIKNLKTPMGNDLLEALGQEDERIPYMVAGAALHDAVAQGGVGRLIEGGGGAFHLYNAGAHLLAGDAISAAKHIGLLGAQAALQSPRAMGKAAYLSGQLGASPVGRAAGIATQGAGYAARAANPIESAIARSQPKPEKAQQPELDYNQYARGGVVKKSAQSKAEALIGMVDKVKKEQSKDTKPFLNLDDNTVAKALEIANRGI